MPPVSFVYFLCPYKNIKEITMIRISDAIKSIMGVSNECRHDIDNYLSHSDDDTIGHMVSSERYANGHYFNRDAILSHHKCQLLQSGDILPSRTSIVVDALRRPMCVVDKLVTVSKDTVGVSSHLTASVESVSYYLRMSGVIDCNSQVVPTIPLIKETANSLLDSVYLSDPTSDIPRLRYAANNMSGNHRSDVIPVYDSVKKMSSALLADTSEYTDIPYRHPLIGKKARSRSTARFAGAVNQLYAPCVDYPGEYLYSSMQPLNTICDYMLVYMDAIEDSADVIHWSVQDTRILDVTRRYNIHTNRLIQHDVDAVLELCHDVSEDQDIYELSRCMSDDEYIPTGFAVEVMPDARVFITPICRDLETNNIYSICDPCPIFVWDAAYIAALSPSFSSKAR